MRYLKKMPLCLAASALLIGVGVSPVAAQQYRKLPPVMAKEDVVRPLSVGFTGRSIMPWFGPDEAPAILITNHGQYFPDRTLLYRQAGKDGSGKAFALPADYPLYREIPFNADNFDAGALIPGGRYQAIAREDGLFDLVHMGSMQYLRNVGKVGEPQFMPQYVIQMVEKDKRGARWIADVNGDGIPDLLVGGTNHDSEKFNQYPDWPVERGPWSGEDHPNMGSLPDTDIQSFRGYDIAGNWMGQPLRRHLWWAKGSLNDRGELQFGAFKPVRYGQTDYRVQWQDYGADMSPVVLTVEGQPYIILFAGVDKSIALPLRGEDDKGELRVGKSVPLMKDNAPLKSANLSQVIGIGDMNGDGYDDIVIGGGANGRLTVISGRRMGEFEEMGNIFTLGGQVAADTLTVPYRADWDGDGYPDLIIGDGSGFYSLWRGTEDPTVYESCDFLHTKSGVIRHRPEGGNLQGQVEDAWSYTQPTIFDWDGDGIPDLISNDNEAKLFLYRGTGKGALVEERERFMFGDKPLPIAWRHRPDVVPGKYGLAGDDRNALVFITWDRKLAYAVPEANGSINFESVSEITYEDGSPVVLTGPAGLSGRIKFTVADWDGDGVWDLVLGVQHGLQKFFRMPGTESPTSAPYWLRNVGTNDKPVFEPARMITHKDGTPIAVKSHDFSVFPTDLTGDGKLDIIFGEDEGFIFYMMRDDLAWDEPVDAIKAMWRAEKEARESASSLRSGVLASEGFDYREGPLTAAADRGGKGWKGGWIVNAEQALIRKQPVLPSGLFNEYLRGTFLTLSGEAKGTAQIRRLLEHPFSLVQQRPTTLEFSVMWQRGDNANNAGNEAVTLLDLCTIEGRSLLAVGTDSDEQLMVRLGTRLHKANYEGMAFQGSWMLRAQIDLPVKGEPLKVRVAASDKLIPLPVQKWDIEAEGNIDGVVGSIALAVGKYAGVVGIDHFELSVK